MEAVALAAGVDINHLLGSVMLALQAKAVNTVKIIAMAHPAITQARVVFGQMPLGEREQNRPRYGDGPSVFSQGTDLHRQGHFQVGQERDGSAGDRTRRR